MAKRRASTAGFTIVELLIVVVVIAILAAITITAYNGVTNQAKTSAVKSAAQQAAKKVMVYATTNSDQYPASLQDVGISNSASTEYQYRTNSAASTFCITVSSNGLSYFASNANTTPSLGVCAGHAPIGSTVTTNYFMNPRFEGASSPVNQTGTTATIATYAGSLMARATATSSSAVSMRLQPNNQRWSVGPGQSVYASVTICNAATTPRVFAMSARFYNQPGTSATLGTETVPSSTSITLGQDACGDLSISSTAPSDAQSVGVNVNRNSGSGSASGDVYYADNVFLSTQAGGFADGATNGWIWNGEVNNSTSTGPQL